MPIYKNGNKGYIVKINYKDSATGVYKQIMRCNSRTRTKTDAKQYELELLASINNETFISLLTFEELYFRFIENRKNELKRNTLSYYQLTIPRYVFPKFQKMLVVNITKEKIIKWKLWLQNEHDFGTVYLNNIFKNFSTIMNYAVKFYDLPSNPLTKVGRFKAPELIHEDKIHYWKYEEFSIFISKVKEHLESQTTDNSKLHWSELYTAFSILFWGGLRRSEALALNWNDIVEVNGMKFLNVYKSINQRITPFEITTTKNKSSIRKVPICEELNKILVAHKNLCGSLCYNFNENNFFICGSFEPIAKNTLGLVMHRVANECNLPQIRIHDLRHSYCSLLINGGFPLSTIAHLLGHANTDITQRVYSHIYPDANKQVIDFINNLNEKK